MGLDKGVESALDVTVVLDKQRLQVDRLRERRKRSHRAYRVCLLETRGGRALGTDDGQGQSEDRSGQDAGNEEMRHGYLGLVIRAIYKSTLY